MHPLGTYATRTGAEVEGALIAPVRAGGHTLLPLGTKMRGVVKQSRRVGLGLLWETARLWIDFNRLEVGGESVPVQTRMLDLDNSRENVDPQGRIRGIRSTATMGFRAAGFLSGIVMFDPIAYLYVNVSSARMLRFTEPEVYLPPGAEMTVRVAKTAKIPEIPDTHLPAVATTGREREDLGAMIRALPFRTATEKGGKPSDLTNLVFIGDGDALTRAFRAAGWVETDQLSGRSRFMTMRAMAENQAYVNAPMSTLLLGGNRPVKTWSKTLNTFAKRHHARVFRAAEQWKGESVWTASSTQDIGISLSKKQKTFIHLIDELIDNERAKIVNDLLFTGCVDAVEEIARPWVPLDAKNSTGDLLRTDGAVAIVRLNGCWSARGGKNTATADTGRKPLPVSGNVVERGLRQSILTVRNDLVRGNLIWQVKGGIGMVIQARRNRGKPKAERAALDVDGIKYSPWSDLGAIAPPSAGAEAAPRQEDSPGKTWTPPLFEIGFEGGVMRFPRRDLGAVILEFVPKSPEEDSFLLGIGNEVGEGWGFGSTVTLNSFRYFSSEWGYSYLRGKYRMAMVFDDGSDGGVIEETTGMLTHKLHYSLLAHLRGREKRFRPYIAAGPALQLIHLTDAPIKQPNGLFKVGLRNVGMLLASYNFARTPPLDGGGIFQAGFQYGGGVKYQFRPHWLVRLDYRETISPQPDFLGKSFPEGEEDLEIYTMRVVRARVPGALRRQALTLGFSFTF